MHLLESGNRACTTVINEKSKVFVYVEDSRGYSIKLVDLRMEGYRVRT